MPSAENRVGITRWERPSLTNTARFVDLSIWRDVPKNGCVRLSSGSARDCRTFFLGWAACMTRPVVWIESWRQASWMIVWQDSCRMFDRLGSYIMIIPSAKECTEILPRTSYEIRRHSCRMGREHILWLISSCDAFMGDPHEDLYKWRLVETCHPRRPTMLERSYWRTRYCFRTFLDRHRNKFLYQFKISSSCINSVLVINLSCDPLRTQNHGLVWARQELDKCIIHIPGTNDVPNAN